MSRTHPSNKPILIIGSSCQFLGSDTSTAKLWDLLPHLRDVSKKEPETRFNADEIYRVNGEHHGSTNVSPSYILQEDPRLFDSAFFTQHPEKRGGRPQ